jgi:hypothetical protein
MPILKTLALFILLALPHPPPNQDASHQVTVPANLEVIVAPRRDIYSNTVVFDERIGLEVVDEVKINQHVIIARGSIVIARITVAKPPASYGRRGELALEFIEVTATDGSTIPLRGNHQVKGEGRGGTAALLSILGGPLLVGRLSEGTPARLKTGTKLKALTEKEATVEVKP